MCNQYNQELILHLARTHPNTVQNPITLLQE